MTAAHATTTDAGAASALHPAPVIDQKPLCSVCAQRGRTCCQDHDIYVTWSDCRRIFVHTRQKEFFEYRGCLNKAYLEQDNDPLWWQHVFRADGSRRVLKHKPNGDCMMLTPSGCSLPLDVRPLVCRLFPHLYSADGMAKEWDNECPAARDASAAQIEQGIAGVELCEAAQWHQLLYDEVLWEGLVDDHWIDR